MVSVHTQSESDNAFQRYGRFSFSKWSSAAILDFNKPEIAQFYKLQNTQLGAWNWSECRLVKRL